MHRSRKHIRNWSFFDHAACIHHRHPVRDLRHHSQIMGDKKKTQPQFAPQFLQQLQNSFLHRDVERGSSAISSRGPDASAMAIMARWRNPPES
jgi:hypothetical protein